MSTLDYWYLCGACGNSSPAKFWTDATCPVCRYAHADDDSDPGVWDGTFAEMAAAKAEWVAGREETT